ncbi:MAG: redox-regulated ATPase YchF [Candidatus Babeliaceae bacterium]|jgi:hypothetical protein
MSIAAGLVGLPNVGKSTLFNALTKSSVPAENYPFCTIDPHVACTFVPDDRLGKLQALYKSQRQLPTTVKFVDIAGLVKGAASGEGLGNQFLSHIREVDLILHVIRCFEDPLITHTQSSIDPIQDYDIIMTELMLKDLESLQKRIVKLQSSMKAHLQPAQLKELEAEASLLKNLEIALNNSQLEQVKKLLQESPIKTVDLLSGKNFLIIANISEQDIANNPRNNNPYVQALIKHFGPERVIVVSAKLESELAQLESNEAHEIALMMGLEKRGLDDIIEQSYKNLGLITFFTCGPQEIHAWHIKNGTSIRQASGEIHSDLEKGFICAEVFNCADLFACGTINKVKESGKVKIEGQDYKVQDGDIVHVRFNT